MPTTRAQGIGTVLLTLAMVLAFGGRPASAQGSCGLLATNTQPDGGRFQVSSVAQELTTTEDCYVRSFSIAIDASVPLAVWRRSFFYTELDNQTQLPNSTFNVNAPAETGGVYTFYSTSPSGIQLFSNTTYWLLLDMSIPQPVTSSQEVPPSNSGAPIALGVYYYFWSGWTSSDVAAKVNITGCPGRIPPPSPSPSASPSCAPAVSPVAKVRSDIDDNDPIASLFKDSERPGKNDVVGVRSSFKDLQLGPETAPVAIDAFVVRTENSTTEAGDVLTTTYYTAGLADNTTSLEQAFAFYDHPTDSQFNATLFTIGANSVKWSVNLTVSTAVPTNNTDGPDNRTMSEPAGDTPLTIRYGLAALSSSVSASLSRNGQVIRRGGEPQAGMTTYYVPLLDDTVTASSSSHSSSLLVAKVEVLDLALVDGAWVPLLSHDVVLANSSAGYLPEYVLVLEFPPFNHSLFYDPSVSLGVLLSRDGSGDTSSDLALIVATSVAIPLAVLFVVAVAVAGVTFLAWRKKQARGHLQRRMAQLRSDV